MTKHHNDCYCDRCMERQERTDTMTELLSAIPPRSLPAYASGDSAQ